jgi:hypothetical protein
MSMSEGRGLPRVFRPGAFELLPWVPSILGVLVMIGLLGFAVVSLRPSDADVASTPAPPPPATPPFLAGPAEPEPPSVGAATPETPVPSPSASAAPRPRRTTPAPPPPTTPPPPPALTGRFIVVDTFSDSFIGEVRVTNTSRTARGWTVRLRFPASVGDLRNFWVEGAPQPKLQRSGDLLTFTSGAPVAAGKAAQLRFQLDRDGSGIRPSTCSVNGTACT